MTTVLAPCGPDPERRLESLAKLSALFGLIFIYNAPTDTAQVFVSHASLMVDPRTLGDG